MSADCRHTPSGTVTSGLSLVPRSGYNIGAAIKVTYSVLPMQVDYKRHIRGLLHSCVQNGCAYLAESADCSSVELALQNGYVVVLVPRQDAVSTKAIKTAYSSTAGTSYVTFDGARAPVANTLGKVGQGMQVVLSNFNHERWMIICTSLAAQRRIVEECLKWTAQRIAFGKPLNTQPVVRARLAAMIARVESGQNWLEFVTHQMNNVSTCASFCPLPGLL